MRGLTAAEMRSQQLQAFTVVGLLADELALAVLRYPESHERDAQVITELELLLQPEPMIAGRQPVIPRRRSMADATQLLEQAAALSQPKETTPSPDMAALLSLLRRFHDHNVSDNDVRQVKRFAEALGRVTLTLAERVAAEKGADDWTPRALTFSVV